MRYAIKVIWNDGDEEFVNHGSARAVFASKQVAEEVAAEFRENAEGFQSVSVIKMKSTPAPEAPRE